MRSAKHGDGQHVEARTLAGDNMPVIRTTILTNGGQEVSKPRRRVSGVFTGISSASWIFTRSGFRSNSSFGGPCFQAYLVYVSHIYMWVMDEAMVPERILVRPGTWFPNLLP